MRVFKEELEKARSAADQTMSNTNDSASNKTLSQHQIDVKSNNNNTSSQDNLNISNINKPEKV